MKTKLPRKAEIPSVLWRHLSYERSHSRMQKYHRCGGICPYLWKKQSGLEEGPLSIALIEIRGGAGSPGQVEGTLMGGRLSLAGRHHPTWKEPRKPAQVSAQKVGISTKEQIKLAACV